MGGVHESVPSVQQPAGVDQVVHVREGFGPCGDQDREAQLLLGVHDQGAAVAGDPTGDARAVDVELGPLIVGEVDGGKAATVVVEVGQLGRALGSEQPASVQGVPPSRH